MTTDDAGAQVLAVIRRINATWLDGRADGIAAALLPCFDENVVFCDQSFQVRARGAMACARSFEDFVGMATVREFSAPDPAIHVAGDTATAVCPWTMTYTLDERTYTESGHDVLVFNRSGGEWRVMWRAMVPTSSS
jgi:ketosteroid isomerase-like protein